MKLIKLTQGQFAMVDDKDYARLNLHKWQARKKTKTFYAYRETMLKGVRTKIMMHNEILPPKPNMQTDHKDRNGLNNTTANLRYSTVAQNLQNRGRQRNNTSGYKGVSWENKKARWRVQIRANGVLYRVGYYFCIIKAAKAYNEKAKQLQGEFAVLNII